MKRKNHACLICGEAITNKKENSEYCSRHNPKHAWDRLNRRYNSVDVFKKLDVIQFNLNYELIQLKKALEQCNNDSEPEAKFISSKLLNILNVLEEVSTELNKKVDKKCI